MKKKFILLQLYHKNYIKPMMSTCWTRYQTKSIKASTNAFFGICKCHRPYIISSLTTRIIIKNMNEIRKYKYCVLGRSKIMKFICMHCIQLQHLACKMRKKNWFEVAIVSTNFLKWLFVKFHV